MSGVIKQFSLVFSVVFAAVSVLGTGMHLLPGCEHFHCASHCCHEQTGCCSGDGLSTDSISAVKNVNHPTATSADCPICGFLALPRALTPLTVVDSGSSLVVPAKNKPPQQWVPVASRPYGARAPPAFLAAI